ncbi:hypothetical protein I7I48_03763 [Histoplasma ohiense]|nr:hypothetical protein I7I48_03763 [Histoplasma ohiense (nom. inval.)]
MKTMLPYIMMPATEVGNQSWLLTRQLERKPWCIYCRWEIEQQYNPWHFCQDRKMRKFQGIRCGRI